MTPSDRLHPRDLQAAGLHGELAKAYEGIGRMDSALACYRRSAAALKANAAPLVLEMRRY